LILTSLVFHKTEAENKLVIFPVVATEKKVSEESCHVGAVQTYPGSKTVKLFPAMFADEKQSVMYFSSELVNYLDNNTEETENQVHFDLQCRTHVSQI
jgi:hypothetical protein